MADPSPPEIGRSIDVGGIRTNVHVLGDPATTPAVLLIHGSGPGASAYSNWRLTMPALADRFAVVAPDIVGFGATQRPDGITYDLATWTAHVLGVLDALEIAQAHIVANSFGGSLALALAIEHPERVRQLVLVAPTGAPMVLTDGLDAVWGYTPSVEAMQELLGTFAYDTSLVSPDLARMRFEASIKPGVQEAFARMFPAPRQRALDAITHDLDAIARIRHRTLVVHGREDQVIPLSSSLTLLSVIPRAQLHVFGECGHWAQIEHAEAFSALVVGFLVD